MVCPDAMPLEPQQIPVAFPYSGLLSNIGNAVKLLNADDNFTPSNSRYSEITVAVESLGTNTYIAVGNPIRQYTRLYARDSYTWEAPKKPFALLRITDLAAVGDVLSGGGILEISGIEVKL